MQRPTLVTLQDAESGGLEDGDIVDGSLNNGRRDLDFGDVLIRVSPGYRLEIHLDRDEANAAGLDSGDDSRMAVSYRLRGSKAISYSEKLDFFSFFLAFFAAFRSFGVIDGCFLPSFLELRSLDMRITPNRCHN